LERKASGGGEDCLHDPDGDLLCENSLPLFETPIGFKHICELMLERTS
jgi:hypothetical protein